MNGPPMQKPQHHEPLDAEVIHEAEVVVGVGVPGPVDLERAGGLAARRVTQVGRNAAILAFELVDGIERRVLHCPGDRGVLPAAGDDQQRDAGAGLLVVNTDVAFLVDLPGGSACGRGLCECARRGGGRRRCHAR